MNGSSPMLEVKNVWKNFGTVKALSDISFDLEEGKILGLVGDNGAGKSTLLKILSGDLQPSGGEIYLEGKAVRFKSPADAMKKGIAIAYQFLELVEIAKVWENFFMGRELTKRIGPFPFLDIERMKRLTAEAIAKYGHTFDVDLEVRDLSGEQRQIIAVTRAIEANPEILLLDESFTLLSLDGRKEILNFLREVNKKIGITMIIVSHDLELIKNLSHYIMVLRGGEKMFFGHTGSISVDEIVDYMLP
ncbi:MAG: sugar ABC transporter ATP-binding protein [Deltaproteobacteria bacterium]|nr:sugar ABC transporter ATP-binding protein [Deltaproteobacteria bacterium]MBW2121095.1 sugar ABC transporter ATP-binding protein [Deltaproteobacteria bacterium]